MLRAIRWLLDAALVLLVGIVIALVLAAQVGPMLGHQPVVIRGGSMEPAIPLGALVDLAHVEPADLAAGDVVTIEGANGVRVTHRIAYIVQTPDGPYIETKGDANEHADAALVPASAVVGRVDFSLPFLGFLMFMLTTLAGFVSIVCLALTLLIAVLLLEDLEKEERADLDDGIDPESKPAALAGRWGDLIG
jgi:signal peptidase